jgi:hypothetical protein
MDLWYSHATTPSSSTLHVNADGLLACPIWASIEDYACSNLGSPGSHSQATDVPGFCPGTSPHSICHISELTPPIKVFLSILKHARHKLCRAYGFTLVTPNLFGWEAFPTPRALTHTRITWVLSPTAAQVSGDTLGCPLCMWCFGRSSWRGARQVDTPNLKGATWYQALGNKILK